jgi:hypothetical protein
MPKRTVTIKFNVDTASVGEAATRADLVRWQDNCIAAVESEFGVSVVPQSGGTDSARCPDDPEIDLWLRVQTGGDGRLAWL